MASSSSNLVREFSLSIRGLVEAIRAIKTKEYTMSQGRVIVLALQKLKTSVQALLAGNVLDEKTSASAISGLQSIIVSTKSLISVCSDGLVHATSNPEAYKQTETQKKAIHDKLSDNLLSLLSLVHSAVKGPGRSASSFKLGPVQRANDPTVATAMSHFAKGTPAKKRNEISRAPDVETEPAAATEGLSDSTTTLHSETHPIDLATHTEKNKALETTESRTKEEPDNTKKENKKTTYETEDKHKEETSSTMKEEEEFWSEQAYDDGESDVIADDASTNIQLSVDQQYGPVVPVPESVLASAILSIQDAEGRISELISSGANVSEEPNKSTIAQALKKLRAQVQVLTAQLQPTQLAVRRDTQVLMRSIGDIAPGVAAGTGFNSVKLAFTAADTLDAKERGTGGQRGPTIASGKASKGDSEGKVQSTGTSDEGSDATSTTGVDDGGAGKEPSTQGPKEKALIKRQHAEKELIDTEISYITSLRLMTHGYLRDLRRLQVQMDITREDINTIFCNVESLLQYNITLIKALKKALKNKDGVGAVFVQLAPFMRIYATYLGNYEFAVKTLARVLRTNETFHKWAKGREESLRTSKSQEDSVVLDPTLMSLLITPVQRVPRYLLMLREIRRHTHPEDVRYAQLTDAIAEIELVVSDLNQSSAGSVQKLMQIQKMLNSGQDAQDVSNQSAYRIELVEPHRKFIKSALLGFVAIKGDAQPRKGEMRMVYLCSDVLWWALSRRSGGSGGGSGTGGSGTGGSGGAASGKDDHGSSGGSSPRSGISGSAADLHLDGFLLLDSRVTLIDLPDTDDIENCFMLQETIAIEDGKCPKSSQDETPRTPEKLTASAKALKMLGLQEKNVAGQKPFPSAFASKKNISEPEFNYYFFAASSLDQKNQWISLVESLLKRPKRSSDKTGTPGASGATTSTSEVEVKNTITCNDFFKRPTFECSVKMKKKTKAKGKTKPKAYKCRLQGDTLFFFAPRDFPLRPVDYVVPKDMYLSTEQAKGSKKKESRTLRVGLKTKKDGGSVPQLVLSLLGGGGGGTGSAAEGGIQSDPSQEAICTVFIEPSSSQMCERLKELLSPMVKGYEWEQMVKGKKTKMRVERKLGATGNKRTSGGGGGEESQVASGSSSAPDHQTSAALLRESPRGMKPVSKVKTRSAPNVVEVFKEDPGGMPRTATSGNKTTGEEMPTEATQRVRPATVAGSRREVTSSPE